MRHRPGRVDLRGSRSVGDIKEVLNTIAVVRRFERRLFETGADPDRGHAQPSQISQLGPQPFQCAAVPAWRLAKPLPIRYGPNVTGGRRRGCSRCGGVILSVPVATLFVAIRESIQHQEVENLVCSTIRRRRVPAPGEGCEIDLGDTSRCAGWHDVRVPLYAPNFSSRSACARSSPIRYLDSILPRDPLAQTVSVNAVEPSLRQVGDTNRRGTGCQL